MRSIIRQLAFPTFFQKTNRSEQLPILEIREEAAECHWFWQTEKSIEHILQMSAEQLV